MPEVRIEAVIAFGTADAKLALKIAVYTPAGPTDNGTRVDLQEAIDYRASSKEDARAIDRIEIGIEKCWLRIAAAKRNLPSRTLEMRRKAHEREIGEFAVGVPDQCGG